MCRDLWALHLNLLPHPPPAEPYLYACEQFGGKPRQSDPSQSLNKPNEDGEEIPNSSSDEETRVDDPESHKSSASSSSSNENEEDEEDEEEEEEDPELEKLLRENSETPSSSEDEDQPRPKPLPDSKKKGREVHRGYDTSAGNISVLMLACWTLRLPVMYMDFIR